VFRSRYNAVALRYPRPANLQLTHPPLGGWDCRQKEFSLTTLIKNDLLEEIDQAFENVDYNLKHAGSKGWSQVYRVVTYSTDIGPQHDRIVENFRKWMPNHCPVWTEIGVKQLGSNLMNFEIDVEAYDEEGAAEARKLNAAAA
jgi:Endoribonuclease L-PSP